MTALAQAVSQVGTRLPEDRRLEFASMLGMLLWLLSGCASVSPVALSTQDTAEQFRSRSLADDGLKRFALSRGSGVRSWSTDKWDTRSLDIAALYFSPTLAVARSKWLSAQAAVAVAGEIPNPTLTIGPQFVATAAADIPAWVLATSLVQIIETGGKRDFREARARYLAEAARLDVVNTAWEIVATVNGALTDVAVARQRLSVIEQQIASLTTLVDIVGKRIAAGIGNSLELATTRTALDRALLEREAARTAEVDAHHRLAQAIGIPVDALALDRVSQGMIAVPAASDFLRHARRDAVLNRADLLARMAEYAASETALQLEVAAQYPDIEVGPGYEYDQGADKWGLSLGFQIPVFDQHQAAIAEAMAKRRQAADELMAVQARVIGEVDRAAAAYESAVRLMAVTEDLFRRQENQARVQQALFLRGETDRLSLLTAKAELSSAELARIEGEATVSKARLALEVATQRSPDAFDPTPFVLQERR